MNRTLAIVGFLILVAGAVIAAWTWSPWMFSPNYTIRIATGPIGSDGQKFIAAFRRELAEQRPRVRLALTETANLHESAEALQDGKVDLAVVRSDHPAAASGGTLLIVRRINLVFMASAHSSVTAMKDLVGKKIGIASDAATTDPLLATVVESYGLQTANLVTIAPADVGVALRERKVAAVVVMGPAGPGAISDAVKAIVKATRKPPKFIALDEAKAIATHHPVYEEVEIPQGAFVAAPAIPDKEVTTVAVSVRLVALNSVLDYVAGELTRLLLTTRAKLAATMPQVGEIEAPETDTKGVLPVHRGAAAYLNGTQESLFEQTMTQLFNFSIIGGLVGSIAIWVGGFWSKHRPDETKKNLARLSTMLREAREVPLERLDGIEEELDTIAAWLLSRFVDGKIAPDRIGSVSAIVSQIRLVIERRRKLA